MHKRKDFKAAVPEACSDEVFVLARVDPDCGEQVRSSAPSNLPIFHINPQKTSRQPSGDTRSQHGVHLHVQRIARGPTYGHSLSSGPRHPPPLSQPSGVKWLRRLRRGDLTRSDKFLSFPGTDRRKHNRLSLDFGRNSNALEMSTVGFMNVDPDEYAFKGGGVWTYGNGGKEWTTALRTSRASVEPASRRAGGLL